MKQKHFTLILLAGTLWVAIGVFLMHKGLSLIAYKALLDRLSQTSSSLLGALASYAGGVEKASVVLVGLALATGYVKGRFVLAKTVKRMVAHIRSLPQPASILRIYKPWFYLVIAAMISLGIVLRRLGLEEDVLGVIDTAIGSSLINGSVFYFRAALQLRRETL